MAFKSGFVSIIGRPNVGKSTLLNTLLHNKVAIVTSKAQTTRNRIQGIYHHQDFQIVFMDTPGVHKPHHDLGKFMNKVALQSTKSADVILLLAPSDEYIGENDQFLIRQLQEKKDVLVFLILTKSDLVTKQVIKEKINQWKKLYNFHNIIDISAINGQNIDILIQQIVEHLPEGHKYFPEDMTTDQPERFLIREIIREKLLLLTEQEVPHSAAVLIDAFEEQEHKNLLRITASIIVERDSQKAIIIGKKGSLIKEIGIQSRIELEAVLNSKIYLELFVKVEDKWRSKASMIAKLGYDKNNY